MGNDEKYTVNIRLVIDILSYVWEEKLSIASYNNLNELLNQMSEILKKLGSSVNRICV